MLMRIGSLVFALPGILLLVLYGLELSTATDCQQQGLFFDALSGQCVSTEPAFSTFYMRHTLLVNLMMLVSVAGAMAMIWGMLLRGMARAKD